VAVDAVAVVVAEHDDAILVADRELEEVDVVPVAPATTAAASSMSAVVVVVVVVVLVVVVVVAGGGGSS